METVGSEDGSFELNEAAKSGSGSASLKQVTDPVVYKLVRVDLDGRLVPATDEEVMEVEDLLELEKNEMLAVSDAAEAVGCSSNEDDLSDKQQSEAYQGLSQSKDTEVDTDKLTATIEEALPTAASNVNDKEADVSGGIIEHELLHGATGTESSVSAVATGLKPDFSRIKGEVNLDKLTIRELQETFKATFGRETSVKDKQWLKRRIAMGLTNSCDVSVTKFIIRDKKLVKDDDQMYRKEGDENQGTGAGAVGDDGNDLLSYQNHMEDAINDDAGLRNSSMENDHKNDDLMEQRAAKRIRKPTRRYIEELSDMGTSDYSGRSISSAGQSELGKASSKSQLRPAAWVQSSTMITRLDSLGGSGVQVPFVSRIRRCRPRKSVTALMALRPSHEAFTTKMIGHAVASDDTQIVNTKEDKVVEITSVPFEDSLNKDEREKKQSSSASALERSQDTEANLVNSSVDTTDDNVSTMPVDKGGMRRKHHRAWTLSEVMKLVDGVSRYGAGRWSEIKRLSFASHSYRTSVDLKDKWRNLLKACFAYVPSEKATNPRKNASTPIPAPILMKVRELAQINGQASSNVRASSVQSGSSLIENKSGYL